MTAPSCVPRSYLLHLAEKIKGRSRSVHRLRQAAGQARRGGNDGRSPSSSTPRHAFLYLTLSARQGFDHKAVTAETVRHRRRPRSCFTWVVGRRDVSGAIGIRVGVLDPIRCSESSQFALRQPAISPRWSRRDWSRHSAHSRRPREPTAAVPRLPSTAPTSLDRQAFLRPAVRLRDETSSPSMPAVSAPSGAVAAERLAGFRPARSRLQRDSIAAFDARPQALHRVIEGAPPRRADDVADIRQATAGPAAAARRPRTPIPAFPASTDRLAALFLSRPHPARFCRRNKTRRLRHLSLPERTGRGLEPGRGQAEL